MSAAYGCSSMVFNERWPRRCSNAAKVERNGKWFCHAHDPDVVKARRQKIDDKYKREREAEDRSFHDCQEICRALGVGVPRRAPTAKVGSPYTHVSLTLKEASQLIELLNTASVLPMDRKRA